MIGYLRRLHNSGVLGMNRRNADFIMAYNDRRRYPLVDDKLRTKELAEAAGIRVPRLYGVIEIERQIRRLPEMLAERDDFVIKPVQGSGGNGILVITGTRRGRYVRSNGLLMDADEVGRHVSNILSGMHSLAGQPDRAVIEQRVEFDPLFDDISFRGVPDIRTVIFRGIPVLAMVRLPSRQSDGKANLHQGAVGAGIDLASGRTTTAVHMDRLVDEHPDTGIAIGGLAIPGWQELLTLAARCHDLAGLGYLGVDIVLDRHEGPMVLELNARPGLSIQLANRINLLHRLRQVEELAEIPDDAAARARLAQALFPGADTRTGA